MIRVACSLLLTGLLMGCGVQTNDLQAFIADTKKNTPVNIEPYPEFTTMPPFDYAAQELRSPFQRPRNLSLEPIVRQQANCLQPDAQREKEALERYGIDALTLSGFFTSKGQQWALFKANDGTVHKATAGNYLGLFFGKITLISNGRVEITELLPDGAGCWQQKNTILSMNSTTGEENNV